MCEINIDKLGNLDDLPQYAIDRDKFCELFNKHGNFSRLLCNILPEKTTENFKIFQNHDEYYIIHLPSGTMVNWYKHEGRTNTCNKALSLEEYETFFKMAYDELEEG